LHWLHRGSVCFLATSTIIFVIFSFGLQSLFGTFFPVSICVGLCSGKQLPDRAWNQIRVQFRLVYFQSDVFNFTDSCDICWAKEAMKNFPAIPFASNMQLR
jgi:hypothetical protein